MSDIDLLVDALEATISFQGPREDKGYTIDGPAQQAGSGDVASVFTASHIFWKKWTYQSTERIRGGCGQEISGSHTESSSYQVSADVTVTGSAKGGASGQGLSGDVTSTVAAKLGIQITGGEIETKTYKVNALANFAPIAILHFDTTEYSVLVIDISLWDSAAFTLKLALEAAKYTLSHGQHPITIKPEDLPGVSIYAFRLHRRRLADWNDEYAECEVSVTKFDPSGRTWTGTMTTSGQVKKLEPKGPPIEGKDKYEWDPSANGGIGGFVKS